MAFWSGTKSKFIIDVSGVFKGYLVDIFTIVLSKGSRDIYTFRITQNQSHDENDLIHNLEKDETYEYFNIAESTFTMGKLIKVPKTYEEEKITHHNDLEKERNKLNEVLEKWSDNFARNVLIVFLLFVVASFGLSVKLIFQIGWESVESWKFILIGPLVLYILALIFEILWEKKFTLEPKKIRSLLKKKRRQKLNKKFDFETKG